MGDGLELEGAASDGVRDVAGAHDHSRAGLARG